MIRRRHPNAIFVERSWPPPRIWGYLLLPVVILTIPALFIGGDFRALAVTAIGLWIFIFGFGSMMTARRHWWITPDELSLDRVPLLVRIMYRLSGRRHVSFGNIRQVETMEGRTRAVEREAFGGKPPVRSALGGSCERFWCKTHVVVRLSQPDEYGDTVLLSTERSQEASQILIQAIKDDQQRRGTVT